MLRLQVSLERAQSAAVHDALDAGYVNATSTYSVQTDGMFVLQLVGAFIE